MAQEASTERVRDIDQDSHSVLNIRHSALGIRQSALSIQPLSVGGKRQFAPVRLAAVRHDHTSRVAWRGKNVVHGIMKEEPIH